MSDNEVTIKTGPCCKGWGAQAGESINAFVRAFDRLFLSMTNEEQVEFMALGFPGESRQRSIARAEEHRRTAWRT